MSRGHECQIETQVSIIQQPTREWNGKGGWPNSKLYFIIYIIIYIIIIIYTIIYIVIYTIIYNNI